MVKQAVKVLVRARPTANFASKNIKIDPLTGTIALNIDKKDEGSVNNQLDSWKFKFDKILQNSSQDEVYEAAAQETVQSVVQGYNGTILCYGQTGAGKTFTMTGSSTNFAYRGVIPRAISQVFREVGNKFDQAITIRVSYVEIYNEMMFDLLSPIPTHEQQASHLQIQDDSRGGVAIKNLSMIVCHQEEDALNQLFEGDMNRTVSEHQLNKASSRSHCVFTIHIESRSRVESSDKVLYSKLHLVDLAGSERTKKTGSSGITLKEATFINKSLSFLEQVVIALCDKARDHVPYRQSKLTNILRDSLGGNCKTLMIANIWPEPTHLEETVSTLKFATRMMRVSNEAIVNIQLDPHLLIKRYEKENRGRITYDAYSPDQVVEIQKTAQQYLAGQVEEIQDIDSLRKVREIFNQIRNSYRKLKQNVEAMQRQIDSDPAALQRMRQEKLEESKLGGPGEQMPDDSITGDQQESVRRKRKPVDKQTAFIEYKEEGDGRTLEKAIVDYRNEMKIKRQYIKNLTQVINTTKQEMDKIKSRLDSKGEEKKAQLRSGGADFQQDFDDDGMGGANGQIEEIIDEEELMLLKEMKDLKKNYRENYDKLKNLKVEVNDIQSNIDSMKQQLIYNFENWYLEEFEAGGGGEIQMDDTAYNQTVKNQYQKGTQNTFQGDALFGNGEDVDDDALAFIRAKRKVDTLHKAKKLEKQRPGNQNSGTPAQPLSQSDSVTQRIQEYRVRKFENQVKTDARNQTSSFKVLQHQISAVIFTKAVILGPLERMKIIMQVKNIALFANPLDKPKSALDLANKIGSNQGLLSYYRGINAYMYKLVLQQSLKFFLYESVFQDLQKQQNTPFMSSLGAAVFTALFTTTLSYPLDLAHGRMAADMSKKPSIFQDKKQNGGGTQQSSQKHYRLYTSTRDCLTKTQMEVGVTKGSKMRNMFKGYPSAIISQVPFTVVLMSTFEGLKNIADQENTRYTQRDERSFITKFLNRFGPSTLALLFAQSFCYPFDTVKRRMQLNGSQGHRNIYRNDLDCFKKILKDEGIKGGLYAGFSVNLIRCFPMIIIQYIAFKGFRFISAQKERQAMAMKGHNMIPKFDGSEGGDTPIPQFDIHQRFSEPIQFSREDSEAIPFIKFIPQEGRFELNPEAGEFLKSLKDVKLGVVAVCGKYRTGKSYLLNKLFVETYFQNLSNTSIIGGNTTQAKSSTNLDQEPLEEYSHLNKTTSGFQVSPTINPCTKGLWIWKKVIYSDQNDCPMIVIDTEGLGAFDEDENHDAKIFLLALLLSSLIIYNSVGTIDESALNNLSLVINLSKKIQLRNRQETPEDIDELASIFPTFIWVLRDFTLKLVDADGNRISSKQYLENALKEQKGCSESIEQKNRIRRLLKHFFSERDCCTLIRPTEKEKDLQDLAKLKEQNLRKDFIEQMNRLKQKVMTKIKVKVMNGHQLNGPMIVELALSYINALNQGQVPNIESAWQNVQSYEQERAFKDSLKYFENQVKDEVRSQYEDIGYQNIKTVLNQVKDKTLSYLKNKFMGDKQSIEIFEKKLKDEIKSQSKSIIKEIQQKIDQQIHQTIIQVFQSSIEDKVRRGNSDVDSFEKVQSEIEQALTIVQIKFINDGERVEQLYRKYTQSKIFKLLETLSDSDKMQSNIQLRMMQEKQNLNERQLQQFKEERTMNQEQFQSQKDKDEQERNVMMRNLKFMEQKIKQLEDRLTDSLIQLKIYKNKECKDQSIQTRRKGECDVQVLDQNYYKFNNNEHNKISNLTQQFNQTLTHNINLQAIPEQELIEKLPITLNQIEQNKKLYNDILDALNNQSKQISQTMSEEFSQILNNNQALSRAIEQSEKRALILEKKLEKKGKYESLIKHCQRLQCNGCSKLYTPMLFVSHYLLCKKQQHLRSSIINETPSGKNQVGIQEEDKEDSQSVIEEQFLAKIVDMKQVHVELRANDDCSSEYSQNNEFASQNSDELVTIIDGVNMGPLTISLRHQQITTPIHQQQQFIMTLEFKFCVLFKGRIWYIHRTLHCIKNVMNRIQRDKNNTEQEQCQIAKWLLEVERNEIEENYQRISEIIETFFGMLHRKIIDNRLSMTIVDDDNENELNQGKQLFFTEFMDFFEIENNVGVQKSNDNSSNWHTPVNNSNHNDDEVIVQMTYDDNDEHLKTEEELQLNHEHIRQHLHPNRGSTIGATIQSTISELCGVGGSIQRHHQGYCMTVSQGHNNHSTIQLDGEKSVNDNSSLHFVSFFSVAEELLMKKNLLGEGLGDRDSKSSLSQGYYEIDDERKEENDENFGSPQKPDRRRDLNNCKPFGSISNRPSTANRSNNNQDMNGNNYNMKFNFDKQNFNEPQKFGLNNQGNSKTQSRSPLKKNQHNKNVIQCGGFHLKPLMNNHQQQYNTNGGNININHHQDMVYHE